MRHVSERCNGRNSPQAANIPGQTLSSQSLFVIRLLEPLRQPCAIGFQKRPTSIGCPWRG